MLRGWKPWELAMAHPDALAAMRWGLFVEKAWPGNAAELDVPLPSDAPGKAHATRARARIALNRIRELIFPEAD